MRGPSGVARGLSANMIAVGENGILISGTTRNPTVALHFSTLTVDPSPTVDDKFTLLWRSSCGRVMRLALGTLLSAPSASQHIDLYLTPGNYQWPKPSGAKTIMIYMIGGGGGGASGTKFTLAGRYTGGSGGGGGGAQYRVYPAANLPALLTVACGKGGQGGANQSDNDVIGKGGSDGVGSFYGPLVTSVIGVNANGGLGGSASSSGGNAPGGTGGAGRVGYSGGTGGASNSNTTDPTPGANSSYGGSGGGGGGASRSGSVLTQPAAGGFNPALPSQAGGTAGVSNAGSNGTDGGDGTDSNFLTSGGTGGGGGGSSQNAGSTGGDGGNGGWPGGGGGGGGGALDGAGWSGAGGSGADGIVAIFTHY